MVTRDRIALYARLRSLNLVPMSTEDMRMRGYRNSRRADLLDLWFVDASGEAYGLVRREVLGAGLDERWPEYMEHNYGIKQINEWRRAHMAQLEAGA